MSTAGRPRRVAGMPTRRVPGAVAVAPDGPAALVPPPGRTRRPAGPAATAAKTRTPGLRTPRQRAGDAAEAAAAAHLETAGLQVLARNVRYRDGELDLVCADGATLVFVEVRMRSGSGFGGAAASVDRIKQNRILRCAQRWLLARHGNRWPGCRFDVITVDRHGTLDWLRDAFGAGR